MHRILAIAGMTLRCAVRSRVFALLAALVMGGILGLPLIMKSDGSLAGQVRLFLEYTLGLSVFLLSVMAVWTGAGAVSLEVQHRQMQLVTVKPVRALEIWIGKWLGLMAINAILLAAAGATIYGLLWWTTRPALLSADDRLILQEQILAARSVVLSIPSGDRAAANASLPVGPGQVRHWQFVLPRDAQPDETILLRYQFVTSRPDLQSGVAGLWLIAGDAPSAPLQYPVFSKDRDYSLRIPVPAGTRRLDVSYANLEETTPVTLLFDADRGVTLLVNESRFAANYFRALLMVLARLGFFSALGLTAGAIFSFPVAVFVSLATLLMAMVNRWMRLVLASGPSALGEEGTEGPLAALVDRLIQSVLQAVSAIMPPLHRLNPLDLLSDGMLISWSVVGQAWLILAGVYACLLAVAGAWWLGRRELGLPAD